MRIYDIMMYLFVFNFLLAIFASVGIFETEVAADPTFDSSFFETHATEHIPQEYSTLDMLWLSFIDILLALPMVIMCFLKATVLLPYFLYQLHIPSIIIGMVTGLTWIVYIIGIAQLWGKWNLAGME